MGENRGGSVLSRRRSGVSWGALVVGVAIWGVAAVRTSPWADEFHSLHHALRPWGRAFLESVRSDNHPPLSFALEGLSLRLFGTSVLALRLPSLLAGALASVLLSRTAWRSFPDSGRFAPWLLTLSSYSVVLFAEARMYGWLFLAGCGVLDVLARSLDDGEEPGAWRWWFSLWLVLGLLSHYYFLHVLFVAGSGLLVGGASGAIHLRRLRPLLAPTLVALLLVAPWYRWAFLNQLTHHLPPGGSRGTFVALAESFPHFFFLNARVGGDFAVCWLAWPGALLVSAALVLGVVAVASRLRGASEERARAVLLLGMGLGLPVWAWVVSRTFGRSTFGWRYLAPAAPEMLILAAVGLSRLPRARFLLLPLMAAVALVVATSGGREDYRRAVALILEEGRPGDAILVKPPWDLDPRPEEEPWNFLLSRVDADPKAAVPTVLGYDELDRAREHRRVWLWVRDPYFRWVERALGQHFRRDVVWRMGPDLVLHRYEMGADAPGD